jgi:2-keto-3-deoxy-L-rhamnonate aldolase RhmA
MKVTVPTAVLWLAMAAGAGVASAQNADPAKYPLAPKAGVDSHSDQIAPAGAVNQGPFNMDTWRRGHAWDPPAGGSPIWNPVKVKMTHGGTLTVAQSDGSDPANYCAVADSGVDFTFTDMQHTARTWHDLARLWGACPHAKAVPGVRIANANEFDEQHALDGGALVLIVPTIRNLAEAREAVKWAYFPPLGQRSVGGSSAAFWGSVPGGYRQTMNDNLVLILQIETLDGIRDVDKIAALPGVSAVYASTSDLGNFSGYKQGDPDYERLIDMVHDAALRSHKYLCGPWAYRDRPDFNCLVGPPGVHAGTNPEGLVSGFMNPAGPDVEQIRRALGSLYNTQGKPTVGPYAPGWTPPPAPPRQAE